MVGITVVEKITGQAIACSFGPGLRRPDDDPAAGTQPEALPDAVPVAWSPRRRTSATVEPTPTPDTDADPDAEHQPRADAPPCPQAPGSRTRARLRAPRRRDADCSVERTARTARTARQRPDRSPVSPRTLADLPTPALLVERSVLEANLELMARALPGERMRPHVKAHKCTSLSRLQRDVGHPGITAATIRECEGLAAAGLGTDLLLANEVTDARRLGALVEAGHRVTLAVDSEATIEAAAAGGRARGRDRRLRRPAAVRVRARGRRVGSPTWRAARGSRSAGSWATRVTSCCGRTPRSGVATSRPAWPSCSRLTTSSGASWSPAPAPAPGPSTPGSTRSRQAPTR